MFNSKALLASILAAVLASLAAATPSGPGTDTSATVTVCSGGVGVGCADVSTVSDTCVNLTGWLAFLNKDISTATVPGGFVCTFFQIQLHCIWIVNAGTNSQVLLLQGTWDLSNVPGLSGPTNFNDLTSSLSCSPL
ncbi:hypothetical protein B0H14DRAFT_3904872 [Mycena olivaceomarginata]|nr:hypothetical protein B0H14DRAFT_3904872 [Mycena olivaceomarginata]